jgi:hypothetical protein
MWLMDSKTKLIFIKCDKFLFGVVYNLKYIKTELGDLLSIKDKF